MPIKYLDPKNDLTFRRIFGEHPHLLTSFLNALLPLDEGREIKSIEYLDADLLPELPGLKRSIVDVRCLDNTGRQFIVEMQMYWTSSFKSRMLFNTSKAYVRQLYKKEKFSELRPIYGLSLLNEDFQTGEAMKQTYYHHYRMVHNIDSKDYIPGIELVFVELQKFKSLNFSDKRLQVLWLKFLTLIDEETVEAPAELLGDKEICEALGLTSFAAFSEEELAYYEKYWDAVRIEKSSIADAVEKAEAAISQAKAEQEAAQMEAGIARENEAKAKENEAKAKENEAKERAEKEKAIETISLLVKKLHKRGLSYTEISEDTKLSISQIEDILGNGS